MDAIVNFLQSDPIPVGLGFVAVLVTIGTPIYRWRVSSLGTQTLPSGIQDPASKSDTMDCRYCGGAGSVVAHNDGANVTHATCGVCCGHGTISGSIAAQPDCRRCNGSGRLLTENIQVVRRRRRVRRQHNSLVHPCDVCGGVGKRPGTVGESV